MSPRDGGSDNPIMRRVRGVRRGVKVGQNPPLKAPEIALTESAEIGDAVARLILMN